MKLYIALDISDDDVGLSEVAEQCGFDIRHPAVLDLTAPTVAHYHETDVLMFELTLKEQVADAGMLLAELDLVLSHPSVSAIRKLGLEA
jgi:hypothetical protein